MARIPDEIKQALMQRNEARAALEATNQTLQIVLERNAGKVFHVEGVPFKVCGEQGKRYWWRMVSKEEAIELRRKWRES